MGKTETRKSVQQSRIFCLKLRVRNGHKRLLGFGNRFFDGGEDKSFIFSESRYSVGKEVVSRKRLR